MPRRILGFLVVQFSLARRLHRFDVIYIRSHLASLPLALWARIRNIPVVQEVNGTYESTFLSWPVTRRFAWIVKWLLKAQLMWADEVITVSPTLREWVIAEAFRPDVHVVPNGAKYHDFQTRCSVFTPGT